MEPLPENDPEALGEKFDNHSNLESSPLPDEDFGKPMKMVNVQAGQSRALQGKGMGLPIPPWPHELRLLFPVQFQLN